MDAPQPSAFLRRVIDRIPRGRALDLAAGDGRNALPLALRGDRVVGIDRSRDALRSARQKAATVGVHIDLIQADLDQYPLPEARFDAVLNFRYLQRSLVPAMRRAVLPGGVVVFETFLVDQLALGHPRNPDYVLAHNELLRLFAGFRVLVYEEGRFELDSGPVFLARLLAERERRDGVMD
jgi:SAM-dependent methyltransferase